MNPFAWSFTFSLGSGTHCFSVSHQLRAADSGPDTVWAACAVLESGMHLLLCTCVCTHAHSSNPPPFQKQSRQEHQEQLVGRLCQTVGEMAWEVSGLRRAGTVSGGIPVQSVLEFLWSRGRSEERGLVCVPGELG